MIAEASVAEHEAAPEKGKVSPGVLLSIAHGEFDSSKLPTLDKKPTSVAQRSFAILEGQHRQEQEKQEKAQFDRIKEMLKGKGAAEEAITPELLRHHHMIAWAKTEEVIITGMFAHLGSGQNTPEETLAQQEALAATFAKLGITIAKSSENMPIADQFYKTSSDTEGSPGSFYEKFCSSNDLNAKLLDTLSEQDIVSLRHFLAGSLGSYEAYDALLATKQTQDALKAQHDFSTDTLSLNSSDQSVLGFFRKGEQLLGAREDTVTQSLTEQSPAATLRLGNKTEVHPEHPDRNDDTFFFDPSGLIGGIFDGAGGYDKGDKASQAARDAIQAILKSAHSTTSSNVIREDMLEAFTAANEAARKAGGSTTACVYQIVRGADGQRKVVVGNMGDSRAWVRRADGSVVQISRDGGMLRSMFLARYNAAKEDRVKDQEAQGYNEASYLLDTVTKREDLTDPYLVRLWDNRNLTNLLGSEKIAPGTFERFEEPMQDGDTIFLTTDGVHDNLTREQIATAARENSDPQLLAETLVAMAKGVADQYDTTKSPNEQAVMRAKRDDITAVAASGALPQTNQPQAPAQAA